MRGSLTPDDLARVLRGLAASRKEGILHLSSDGVSKRIYVSGGSIIFAGSDDEQERLGEVLVRAGRLERTDLELALKVMKETHGYGEDVTDDEIRDGIKLLAETEGIFTETAGGVVVSGLKNLAETGVIKPDELAVVYITGNGLKTQEAVEGVVDPLCIKPTMGSFEEALNQRIAAGG